MTEEGKRKRRGGAASSNGGSDQTPQVDFDFTKTANMLFCFVLFRQAATGSVVGTSSSLSRNLTLMRERGKKSSSEQNRDCWGTDENDEFDRFLLSPLFFLHLFSGTANTSFMQFMPLLKSDTAREQGKRLAQASMTEQKIKRKKRGRGRPTLANPRDLSQSDILPSSRWWLSGFVQRPKQTLVEH